MDVMGLGAYTLDACQKQLITARKIDVARQLVRGYATGPLLQFTHNLYHRRVAQGPRGGMGRARYFFMTPKRVVFGQRLGGVYVQGRPSQMPAVEQRE